MLLKKITPLINSPIFVLMTIHIYMASSLAFEIDSLFVLMTIPLTFIYFIKDKLHHLILNIFLLTIITLLLIRFNLRLSPELAINFFFVVYTFKFLQLKTIRDFHICVQTMILISIASSLFNKAMTHQFFVLMSLLALLSLCSYKNLKEKSALAADLKKVFKLLLIASPLFIALFSLFPRFRYFFPSLAKPKKNVIGYSREINLKDVGQIQTSNKIAMRVSGPKVPPEERYWRGSELFTTDGLNWRYNFRQQEYDLLKPSAKKNLSTFSYFPIDENIKDYIFLDYPFFSFIDKSVTQVIKPKRKNPLSSYEQTSLVQANKNVKVYSPNSFKKYLQLPNNISAQLNLLSAKLFSQENSLEENIENFKRYIIKEKYYYSLSPGKMRSLNDLLVNKIGFCSHYSSFLAILLRISGIPSRIISGFQGGTYNDFGKYYLIRSNDAHVWVEAYMDNRWHRIDPTFFIGPNRIILGGQNFYQNQPFEKNINKMIGLDLSKNSIYLSYLEIQKVIDNLNYQTQLFFDNFNLDTQKAWAKQLGLSLKRFMGLSLALVISICLFIYGLIKLWKILFQNRVDDWWDQKYLIIQSYLKKKNNIEFNNLTPHKMLHLLKKENRKTTQLYKFFLRQYIIKKYEKNRKTYSKKKLNYFWYRVKLRDMFSRN